MRKFIVLFVIAVISANLCYSSDILSSMKIMNSQLLNFDKKMYSCTPYKQQLTLYSRPVFYEVVGVEKNTCHVNKEGQNCYYPMNVVQTYASKKIQDHQRNLDAINRNKSYDSRSINDEYYNKMDDMYCKY